MKPKFNIILLALLLIIGLYGEIILSAAAKIDVSVSDQLEYSSVQPSFVISGNSFLKDGVPFRIISGSIHYFRTLPEQWEDRLTKAYQAGLNTVQFYIPWNLHEPTPGNFNFEGIADVVTYIKLAQKIGLLVVLRPGPYICGEWEFGGFPYWLLKQDPSIGLRSSDPNFLNPVTSWFETLLPLLAPLLYSNGGPIIMVQVENEYGSYGSDKQYLIAIRSLYGQYLGEGTVIYHSTDGPSYQMISSSYIGSSVFQTIDFGPGGNAAQIFPTQFLFQKSGPSVNSEYYTGWLTHWGDAQAANVSTQTVVQSLKNILDTNTASVNFYMFQGGTNFGFMNGANSGSATDYEITITSYDYNSPLTESGDPTDKYYGIRNLLSNYTTLPPGPAPAPSTKGNYGTVQLTQSTTLFNSLTTLCSSNVSFAVPLTFEQLDLPYGFVLYSTQLSDPVSGTMTIQDLADRAYVFISQTLVGVLQRPFNDSLDINALKGNRIDILIENQGRINYGPFLRDPKGITVGVRVGNLFLNEWSMCTLPLTDLSGLKFSSRPSQNVPTTFYSGTFNVTGTPLDSFLVMSGFGKGNVWINNFNLGRYWGIGPQYSLYVPFPILSQGTNSIVILELEGTAKPTISFSTTPIWNHP